MLKLQLKVDRYLDRIERYSQRLSFYAHTFHLLFLLKVRDVRVMAANEDAPANQCAGAL